ncbi:hypothetical protein FNV43_RR02155 [Rhamnella rubrinervis]|uniref:Uncharacterized protein n=1 Tax=Rhamnella rubrinervis TaxID=2594499 RepID=A0A8K0HR58_9ROSA|nr:hypothetical protein FNV43_RR02155 [Rhamnella rubrinervis]
MAVTAQLVRYSSLPYNGRISNPPSSISFQLSSSSDPLSHNRSDHVLLPKSLIKSTILKKLRLASTGYNNGNGGGYGGGGNGNSEGWCNSGYNDDDDDGEELLKALGRFLSGWFFRWVISGNPRFPFDILMKELFGAPVYFVMRELYIRLRRKLEVIFSGMDKPEADFDRILYQLFIILMPPVLFSFGIAFGLGCLLFIMSFSSALTTFWLFTGWEILVSCCFSMHA